MYTVKEIDTRWVQFIYGYLDSALLQSIIAVILIYIQAIYLNRIVIKHKLAQVITLLPGMIFIIFTSMLPEYSTLSPYLIGNTLILVVIGQLFKIYKRAHVAAYIFNVGFWLGVACLFVPNYIYLIIVCIFSVLILRSIKQKELIQLIGGVLTFAFILLGVLYLLDLPIFHGFAKVNFYPNFSIFSLRGEALFTFLALTLIAFFTLTKYHKYLAKKSIQSQKKIDILFWFLLASSFLLFLSEDLEASNALIMFIPLSVFLTSDLISIKNPLIQELIHIAAVALVFSFNFGLI